jgi:hypothetical protein
MDKHTYHIVCKKLQTIQVLPTTDHCYLYIAIHYYKTNTTQYKTGFLRSQGIITQSSSKAPCENTDTTLVIDEASVIINRKLKNITVEDYTISLRQKYALSFVHPVITHLFDHHQLLMKASNIIETMNDILTTKEGDDVFFIKKIFYSQHLISNIPEEVNNQPKVSYNNITKEVKLQPMALYNEHTNDIDIQAII